MGPEQGRIPGEQQTARIQLPADPPARKPVLPAETPGSVRAALVFGGSLFAHLVLGLAQPHATSTELVQWAMVAFMAMAISGLVGMYVQRAEGFRTIMLTLQLLCSLSVIVLDGIYWVRLVMG